MGVIGQIAWNKGIKGSVKANATSFKPGFTPWNKGKKTGQVVWNKGITGLPARHTTPHTEETKNNMSETYKKLWAEGRYDNRVIDYTVVATKSRKAQRKGSFISCLNCKKEFYCSPSCLDAKYCSNECQAIAFTGEGSPLWKKDAARRLRRHSTPEYRKWRKEVFRRDDYTCQYCLIKGCFLHAHHIKSWAKFPELRFDLNNGLTLCKDCHYEIHRKKR